MQLAAKTKQAPCMKAEKAVCDAAEAAAEQPRRDEAEKVVWDSGGIEQYQQYTRADIKEQWRSSHCTAGLAGFHTLDILYMHDIKYVTLQEISQ